MALSAKAPRRYNDRSRMSASPSPAMIPFKMFIEATRQVAFVIFNPSACIDLTRHHYAKFNYAFSEPMTSPTLALSPRPEVSARAVCERGFIKFNFVMPMAYNLITVALGGGVPRTYIRGWWWSRKRAVVYLRVIATSFCRPNDGE